MRHETRDTHIFNINIKHMETIVKPLDKLHTPLRKTSRFCIQTKLRTPMSEWRRSRWTTAIPRHSYIMVQRSPKIKGKLCRIVYTKWGPVLSLSSCVKNSLSNVNNSAFIRYKWARRLSVAETSIQVVKVNCQRMMLNLMIRKWCPKFSNGRQQNQAIPRPKRMHPDTTDANVKKTDDLIKANRCITIHGIVEELRIEHEIAHNIIHDILR